MNPPSHSSPSSGVLRFSPPEGFCESDHCDRCKSQFRTLDQQLQEQRIYSSSLNPGELWKITWAQVVSIRKNMEHIRDFLATHGDTFLSRWKKWTRTKRGAILEKSFSEIFPTRWILAQIDYNSTLDPRGLRSALLLNYLSIDLLKEDPLALPKLLYLRTHFIPEDWAAWDNEQIETCWWKGSFDVEMCQGGVILHGREYGKVVPWDVQQAHQGDMLGGPRAKLLIEQQKILMDGLRRTLDDTLNLGNNGAGAESGSEKWNELVSSGFKGRAETFDGPIFSNQAFRSPLFDIDHISKLIHSCFSEAGDQLELLQTDPVYFRANLDLTTKARVFRKYEKHTWHQLIAMTIWQESVDKFVTWKLVAGEFDYMATLYASAKAHGNIRRGHALPLDLEQSMACLEQLLLHLIQVRALSLAGLLPRMEGFQDCFGVFELEDVGTTIQLKTQKTGTENKVFVNDPLAWCIDQICRDPSIPKLSSPATLFSFLDTFLHNDSTTAKDRARLDENMLRELSCLQGLHEVLAAIRLHRPTFRSIKLQEAIKIGNGRPAWRALTPNVEALTHPDADQKTISRLLQNIEDSAYPQGVRDEQWLKKAEKSRDSLKAYWDKAREMYKKESSATATEEDKRADHEDISFDSKPEYLELIKAEREAALAPKPSKSKKPVTEYQDPTTQLGASTIPREELSLPLRPQKIKNRPEPSELSQEPEAPTPVIEETRSIPDVPVKASSLAIFLRMFPADRGEHEGAPLGWNKFLAAMVDAGFEKIECHGSSAHSFERFVEPKGTITFHMPHPSTDITQVRLQRWGTRLNKWFGFERESFHLR